MTFISKSAFVIIALIIASIFINGCSTESPVRPDPCAGKTPVNADFEIYEQLRYDSLFVADTVLEGNVIHFIAKNSKYDSYRWIIGNDDSLFTANKVALRFNGVFGDIPIKLIVHSKPDSSCFPNDDGIDSVEKTLSVFPYEGGSALIGDYFGCNLDTPKDSFIVNIRYHNVYENGQLVNNFYYVNNMNKGCCEPEGHDSNYAEGEYTIGYRNLKFIIGTYYCECKNPIGYAQLDKNHEFIRFRYFINTDTTKYYEYVGKKIK